MIFCGSGTTAAIDRFVRILAGGWRHRPPPLVFIGPYERAGPPGHDLLGIGPRRARQLAARAVAGRLGVKPGWARVSLAYHLSDDQFAYIVDAVHHIAAHGAGLRRAYRFDERTGLWWHRDAERSEAGWLRRAGTMDGVSSGG